MSSNTGKRICVMILMIMILLCIPVLSQAEEEEPEPYECSFEILLGDGRLENGSVSGEISTDPIRFFQISDSPYFGFVLPDSWDTDHLQIFLNGIDSVRMNDQEYLNGDLISLPLNEPLEAAPEGEDAITIKIRKTGGLPVLFVQTESGNSDTINADKTVSEPGSLLMTDPEGELIYQGNLSAVRARGNATFTYDKKPYQIKLEKSTALVGTREGKTWVLLANVIDRSQIRNKLALDLAAYSHGFSFTSYGQSVDLYMNRDYMGTYLLVEKTEVQKNRLQITDLEKTVKDMNPELDFSELNAQGDLVYKEGAQKYYELPAEPEDLSGGYLFQINFPLRYPTEASAFVTSRGCVFTAQEPKYLSAAQTDYLSTLLQQIEDALFSEDGIDPASGKHYTELLDLTSFVNKYLMAEVLEDYDGQLSYFYKDSDAVDPMVYAGPVWDQDNILGVWLPVSDPAEILLSYEHRQMVPWFWFTQASRHEDFMEAVRETYQTTYRPAILILLGQETDPQGILKSIDEYAAEVSISAEADFFRWPFPPSTELIRYNTATGDSFEKQIDYLKNYLSLRLSALDQYFIPE